MQVTPLRLRQLSGFLAYTVDSVEPTGDNVDMPKKSPPKKTQYPQAGRHGLHLEIGYRDKIETLRETLNMLSPALGGNVRANSHAVEWAIDMGIILARNPQLLKEVMLSEVK